VVTDTNRRAAVVTPTIENDGIAAQNRSFAQRIGGRWLISRYGFATSVVLTLGVLVSHLSLRPAITTSVDGAAPMSATNPTPTQPDTLLMFAYWVAAVSFATLVGIVAHFTVCRRRAVQPVPLWVAGAYLLANLVPPAIIYEVGRGAANLVVELSLVQRVMETSILALLSSGAFILAIDHLAELRALRNEFLERRIQTVLLEQSRQGFYRELEQQLRSEVGHSIREVDPELMSEIQSSKSSDLMPNATRIISTLNRVSTEVVQPVSRRLWQESSETFPPLRVREVMQTMLARQPFPAKSLALLTVLANYGPVVEQVGVTRGVVTLSVNAALVIAICGSANVLMRRAPRMRIAIILTAFVILQVATHVANLLGPTIGLAEKPVDQLVVQVLWSATFILATMSFSALVNVQREHLAQFAEQVDDERVTAIANSRRIADVARETSRVLHGAVQTRLAVCSLAIERAQKSNDQAALALALEEAIAILHTPVERAAAHETIGAEVARKAALWAGFCEVSVNIASSLRDEPHAAAQDVGRLVEEAISNAVRHGGATHIVVNVAPEADGAVSVVVEDDGVNDVQLTALQPGRSAHRRGSSGVLGVGSAMFEQITGGNWSLTRRDGSTHLRATVPAVHRMGC